MTTFSAAQLNDSDLEQLSAYLDRQLSDEERRTLEERLGNEPELRRTLDELRATVGVLRDLEPVRPPRSFTIAPESVAPRRSWLGWLTAVPVVAVLMIAILFSQMPGGSSTALAPVAQQAAAPTALPGAESSAAREAPPQAPEAAAPITMDAAATAAPAAEPTAAPAPTMMPAATAMPATTPTPPAAFQAPGNPSTASEAGDTALPPVEPAAIAAAPSVTPLATAPAETANEAPAEAAGGAIEPTALATQESALTTMVGQAPEPNPYEPSTRAVSAPQSRSPLSLLVGIPIGLAIVVLVLVVLARRRRQ